MHKVKTNRTHDRLSPRLNPWQTNEGESVD